MIPPKPYLTIQPFPHKRGWPSHHPISSHSSLQFTKDTPPMSSSVVSNVLDKLYIVFVLTLLIGIVCFDILHWPVWPKSWIPSFAPSCEQYHIKTFNDPLSGNLPFPNGWQSGMYFCEQVHLPFLLYFLFAKSTILHSSL